MWLRHVAASQIRICYLFLEQFVRTVCKSSRTLTLISGQEQWFFFLSFLWLFHFSAVYVHILLSPILSLKHLRFETFPLKFSTISHNMRRRVLSLSLLFVFLTIIVPLKQAPPLSRAIQTIQRRHLTRTGEEKRKSKFKIMRILLRHINAFLSVSSRNIIAEKNLLLVLTHSEKKLIVDLT